MESSWLWEGHCISRAPSSSAAKWDHNVLCYVTGSLRWSNEIICVTVHVKNQFYWSIILCSINWIHLTCTILQVLTGHAPVKLSLQNYRITEYFHHSRRIFVLFCNPSLLVLLLLDPSPSNHPHSAASHCFLQYRLSLYFLVFYVNEIIQPTLFASAFFQVVGQFWDSFICFNSVPFLLIAEQYSIAWMSIFSLHLLTDIQVTSWFGLLWNIPAMNICVQVFI